MLSEGTMGEEISPQAHTADISARVAEFCQLRMSELSYNSIDYGHN